MSDYIARAKEVAAVVLGFVTSSQAAESAARQLATALGASTDTTLPPSLSPDIDALAKTLTPQQVDSCAEERVQFQNKVWPYFDARNKTMQQLAGAMEILENKDDDFLARWKQPVDALVSTYASTLGTLLSGISYPTQQAVLAKSQIQPPEDAFLKSLAALPVAAKWNDMRKLHRELLSTISSLRTRWDSCVAKAREINQSSLDVVGRLDSKYQAAVRGAGSDYSDAASAIHDAYDTLNAAASAGSVSQSSVQNALDDAAASLGKMATPLANLGNAWSDALTELQSGLPALTGFQSAELDGVHNIFKDIRKEVAGYVREPASNRAKTLQSDAEAALASWVSGMSDGSKNDASDFRYDCLRKTDAGLDEIKKNWDVFEKENKGKFYETMSSGWLNTLLFQDEWKAKKTFLVEPGNIDSPRFAEEQIANTFSVPLEQAYNGLIAAVKDKIDESVQATVQFQVEKSRDSVMSDYRTRTDPLRATLSAVYDLVKTDSYRNLFDRPQMESSLKSS